jgi:hypothetical protein
MAEQMLCSNRLRECFNRGRSLHSPAPRLKVGANRAKSTEGTKS